MRLVDARARGSPALPAAARARGRGSGSRSRALILLLGATGWFAHQPPGARRGAAAPGARTFVRGAEALGADRAADYLPAPAAQRGRAAARRRHPRRGRRDPARGGLSFLGLGVQPPTPSWGGMILDARVRPGDRALGRHLSRRWRSSSPCSRSTWSATPCATPSIPGAHDPLLEVADLRVTLPRRRRHAVHPVDGVSFTLERGRDAGAGRRVGLRQEPHQPGAAPAGAAAGPDRARQRDPARRHRPARARGRGAPRRSAAGGSGWSSRTR